MIAANDNAAKGTQDSAKLGKGFQSTNNSGQAANTQAKSAKMRAESSSAK